MGENFLFFSLFPLFVTCWRTTFSSISYFNIGDENSSFPLVSLSLSFFLSTTMKEYSATTFSWGVREVNLGTFLLIFLSPLSLKQTTGLIFPRIYSALPSSQFFEVGLLDGHISSICLCDTLVSCSFPRGYQFYMSSCLSSVLLHKDLYIVHHSGVLYLMTVAGLRRPSSNSSFLATCEGPLIFLLSSR